MFNLEVFDSVRSSNVYVGMKFMILRNKYLERKIRKSYKNYQQYKDSVDYIVDEIQPLKAEIVCTKNKNFILVKIESFLKVSPSFYYETIDKYDLPIDFNENYHLRV